MKKIFEKPYIYWLIGIFLVYELINFFISGFYNTFPLILKYASSVNWIELSVSLLFSLIIGILVSINAIYGYIRYKERKNCIEGNALVGIGTIGGLATGFCPLCVTGLLPLIFGLFGISFSFASLPLNGIEIQVLAVIILIISLMMIRKIDL